MPFGFGASRLGGNFEGTVDGAFEYESKISVENSQVKGKFFVIDAQGGVSNKEGPFLILIDISGTDYINLRDARLEIGFKVTRRDGSSINTLGCQVAPVNLLPLVMWESIEVRLNGQPMSGGSSVNMGYKAFLEAMLSTDNDASMTHMATQFLHMDTAGQYDNHNLSTKHLMAAFRKLVDQGRINLPSADDYAMLGPGATKVDGTAFTEDEIIAENKARRKKKDEELYKLFAEHMLTDKELVKSHFQAETYAKDSHNHGFNNRAAICADSEEFTLFSPVPHDFFSFENYLAPFNKVELKLSKYPDRFLLNTEQESEEFKLVLTKLKLHLHTVIRKQNIEPPLKETYKFVETQLFKQVVPGLMRTFSFRMFHTGIMPKSILLAMVRTSAAEGKYNLNPFNFHHFNLRRISLVINGEEHPSGGLQFRWLNRPNPEVMVGYNWMYANSGALDNNRGNIVDVSHFTGGCFIIPFDLTPDRCNGRHTHNAEFGFIDVYLDFEEPLPVSITVLYELMFNKVLINDKTTGTVAVVDIAA